MKNTPKSILITSLMAMITAMPLAQANHNTHTNSARYSNDSDNFIVKAKVVRVTPIYKYVTFNTPAERCYKARVTHANYNDGNRAGRMLLGGIIGGVIGNNVGHGRSRKATAVVGAIIGSQIGSNSAQQHAYSSRQVGYEQRCETQNVSETKREIEGYNVSYRYRGRVMTTQMPYNPGRKIRINVSVSPVIN